MRNLNENNFSFDDENEIQDSSVISHEDNNEKFFQNENIVKKLNPAKWDALIDILDFLIKENDDSVIIHDSIILYSYKGGAIIKVDLTEIFDNEKINLHISSPKKWVPLFKILSSKSNNEYIYILDQENKFVVTNGAIKLFLPKQVAAYTNILEMPNFDQTEQLNSSIIQKDSRDKILKLSKSANYIEYLIYDKKLKCINIPNTAIFIMPEFLQEENIHLSTSSNADLTLRTQTFLPYSADTYQMIIGKNLLNDSYFSYTVCISNLIKIEIYEQLENSSGIDQLF